MSQVLKALRYYGALLLPTKRPVTALVGGGVGLAGDLANFVSGSLPGLMILAVFLISAAVLAVLCIRLARQARPERAATPPSETAECWQCDGLRLGVFAVGVFGILLLIGQGESGVERISNQLRGIETDVTDIHEAMQQGMIIRRPSEAGEYFSNAWVLNGRRDSRGSIEALDEMYERFNPKKLDAAELYWRAGLTFMSRDDLIARMTALGDQLGDGSFYIALARNVSETAASEQYRARARELQPDLPFGYYDPMSPSPSVTSNLGDNAAIIAEYEARIALLDVYIERLDAHPMDHYFFIPEYAGDQGAPARSQRDMYTNYLATHRELLRQQQSTPFGREVLRRQAEQRATRGG